MTPAAERTTAKRGRPRSVEAGDAILAATLELTGEVGIGRMSMDDVASRAGVSKATIYRRWSTKEELVLDALTGAIGPFDDVDTGSLRSDLEAYLAELVARFHSGKMSDVLPHLIGAAAHDERIRDSLDRYVHVRRGPLRQVFVHAVARAELPEDADVEILVDLVIGPLTYRRLMSHDPIDLDVVDRLLRHVLAAAAATRVT